MKASSFYGSKTMKASDIPKGGIVAVIEDVIEEDFEENGKERTKLTLQLTGQEKRLVLNATNATALIEGAGDETDNWPGVSIKLKTAKTNFNGNRVDGIVIAEVTVPQSEPKKEGK